MTTTSKEYAQALFALAAEAGVTRETMDGLITVQSALMQTPEYRLFLQSPAISKKERTGALEETFRGKIPEILLVLLKMMVNRGQMGAFNGMVREYEILARNYQGESLAMVTSAVPLEEAEMVELRAGLEKKLGRHVVLRCAVDPTLIGGMRVEVDNQVIDGSIRNRLQQIKEVMNA
jgi:F-type H+-transporting ATPase subunit delta